MAPVGNAARIKILEAGMMNLIKGISAVLEWTLIPGRSFFK